MIRRLIHVALAIAVGFAVVVALPPSASAAIPGFGDCKDAPTPEIPGRGLAGFFSSAPKQLPPQEDPFKPGAKTSIYEQYGYAGLRWNTYDLGCGPQAARDPDAVIGTTVANWLFTLPKTAVAFTVAVVQVAFHPTFLGVFDPLVRKVTTALHDGLFTPWSPLFLGALGFLLIWRSRRANLASTAGAVAWALLVLVIAAALFRWPVQAGRVADQSVTTALGAVSGTLDGRSSGSATTGELYAGGNVHGALLYQTWLAGELGSSTSPAARKYGPALFDAQALTWRQAQTLQSDPEQGKKIVAAKQAEFKATAAKIKDEDPDAYQYLVGKQSDTRIGFALLGAFAALCTLPFLFAAALLVIAAFMIVRFAVMLFPAFATLGVFPTMRGVVTGVGNTVGAALVNSVLFGIGGAITLRDIGILLSPQTRLPEWLALVLMLLFSVVMWIALRPFRRLTQMVTPGHNAFGDLAGGVGNTRTHARRLMSRVGTAIAAASGAGAGAVAAEELLDRHERAEADRSETFTMPTPTPEPTPYTPHAPPGLPALPARTGSGYSASEPESSSARTAAASPAGHVVDVREPIVMPTPGGTTSGDVYIPAGGRPVPSEAVVPPPIEPAEIDGDLVHVIYRPGEGDFLGGDHAE